MGKLYKRGNTYYADFYDRDGRRRQKSTRTGDIKVARAKLRDMELRTTDRAPHETEALAVALDYFVNVRHAGSPAGTIRCYRQKSVHVARLLGEHLVDAIDREAVERYIAARLEEGAHTHSIHKELVVLRGALKAAKARDRFHGSLDVVPRFDAQYTPRTTYLTADQFIALCQHLVRPARANSKPSALARRERRRTNRALRCLLIALASPRLGELDALDWTDVDLGRDTIRVPEGKTISRLIAIHPVLRPWLEALHAGVGPVVEPWPNMSRDLPAAAKRAGIPLHVTANDLRRTFASWLVQAGVSLYVVSRLLGHKSTRMVEMVYGQLDDATLAEAIGRLPGGSHAGVTHAVPNRGAPGAGGATAPTLAIVNSVEMSFSSTQNEVPRDGVEPPTRGFSGLTELAPKCRESARLLRVVK